MTAATVRTRVKAPAGKEASRRTARIRQGMKWRIKTTFGTVTRMGMGMGTRGRTVISPSSPLTAGPRVVWQGVRDCGGPVAGMRLQMLALACRGGCPGSMVVLAEGSPLARVRRPASMSRHLRAGMATCCKGSPRLRLLGWGIWVGRLKHGG